MKEISNQEAFAQVKGEQNIGINTKMHDFQFTKKWFKNRNQKTWSTYLKRDYSNAKPVNMLQIGVFEGMDLVWCLQHVLGHKDSLAVAVDPWAATRKLPADHMESVYQRALHNLSPWRHQVQIIRDSSANVLPELFTHFEQKFDLIVVDGDHEEDAVYKDALCSYHLCKIGGRLVFDDVRNKSRKPKHVLHGLRKFMREYKNFVKLDWQHRHCDCYERIA